MSKDSSGEKETNRSAKTVKQSVPEGSFEATIDIRRWVRNIVIVMGSLYAIVLLLDYHINYARVIDIDAIRRMVNMTREDAIGSWIAVTQTAFVAFTLWLLYFAIRRLGVSKWRERGWLLIAFFFTYLCFDDGNKFHERMGTAFKVSGAAETSESVEKLFGIFPSYSWQFVFMPYFIAMAFFIVAFTWREFGRRAWLWVIVALSFWAGAVGLDFIEGLEPEHPLNLYTWIADRFYLDDIVWTRFQKSEFDTLRHFSKAIEEVMEMTGTTIFWMLFLTHLARVTGRIRLSFVNFGGE